MVFEFWMSKNVKSSVRLGKDRTTSCYQELFISSLMLCRIPKNPTGKACRTELFHTSTYLNAKFATTLAQSLSPKSKKSGTIEVASRASFTRDDAPHKGMSPVVQRGRRPVVLRARESGQSPRNNKDVPSSRIARVGDERRRHTAPNVHSEAIQGSTARPLFPSTSRDHRSDARSNKNYEEMQDSGEFYHPPSPISTSSSSKGKSKALVSERELPTSFTSPPLLPGFVSSLKEMLGPDTKPTPIQSLSMKWLLESDDAAGWRQVLLAAETGSGKSIAYLLPVLQNIKLAELLSKDQPPTSSTRPYNPRGLILAPTHELSRQLSGFAKSLLHETKLRVVCASQSNVKNTKGQKDATSSKMASMFQDVEGSTGEFQVSKSSHPVDLLVGTPMKVLEMVRGRGWDRREGQEGEEDIGENEENQKKLRRGRDKMPGIGKWRSKPELGLANVEWVVVDEADVLFDPDFQETTRTLLADISEARGAPVPLVSASSLRSPSSTHTTPEPTNYPFNLLLTSATIPNSLNAYLEKHHPSLVRLASPRLHHLPKTLQTEYVSWTGGNKFADILRRIRRIWAEDSAGERGSLSKVLIFCNKSTKVVELSAYLAEQGIKSVAMTSQSEHRGRGSNKHLDGFLRTRAAHEATTGDVKNEAHVMVTTSLLSRGLDFTPEIKHVFIVDEPRNMIDFLHRAGRSGRAGQRGKVVIFGKMKGRGSERVREVRKRVGALAA
ncbi:unnamed protein product [Cyclocybe aegerita]|uniref:RNA helicase n=1 Tax=Cyclocybe aegerita TaxID=1973307 RepID=A0A8S0XII1_CYCAE|nr:unnamed protein product [Cyclocybe aegerita]